MEESERKVLEKLLEKTRAAQRLIAKPVETVPFTSLIADIKSTARKEYTRLEALQSGKGETVATLYHQCMIGIHIDFTVDNDAPYPMLDMQTRLHRAHDDITRPLREDDPNSKP